jgi:hypothetical protein
VFWPVMAGSLRLVVAGFGAWVAASMFGVGEQTVFAIVASATIVYGLMSLIAVKCTSWGVRPPRR